MGGATRDGKWVVPAKFQAIAIMGGIELDLTSASFAAPEATIEAYALMGGVEITVPPDITVVVHGGAFMGGFGDSVHQQGPARRAGPARHRVRADGRGGRRSPAQAEVGPAPVPICRGPFIDMMAGSCPLIIAGGDRGVGNCLGNGDLTVGSRVPWSNSRKLVGNPVVGW